MAKQSGLHQIRGKVGEYSYYKQSGVAPGLIRSINQGMSARVKNGAEYANTRLNNQEFGAAADTASLLGKTVVPKFRPMILPFSQSKMSKEVLRLARENSSAWGQRTVSSTQTAQLAAVLSAQSKRNYSEFVSVGVVFESGNDFDLEVSWSATQATLMESLGITHMSIKGTVFNLATGQWNAMGNQMMTGYVDEVTSADVAAQEDVSAGTPFTSTETVSVPTFVPTSNHAGHQIVVFVITPIRQVNTTYSILQEYCSFIALELPARE